MKGKNVTKTVFVVVLILWAIYALWPTYKLQSLPPEKRSELEEKGKLVDLIGKAIRLGLDLQGGMYLKLEVDLPTLIEQIARNKDDRFNELLSNIKEEMNVGREDVLTILNRHFDQEGIPLNRYWGERGESNSKIITYLKKEAKEAVDRSLKILRNRIDQFGVSEPSIQLVGSRRILIELPGISDPDQAKELIGATALLEFKLLKEPMVFSDIIERIDKKLSKDKGKDIKEEEFVSAEEDTAQKEVEQKVSQDKAISVSELFGEDEEELFSEDTTEADTSILVDEDIFEENPFLALLRDMSRYGHNFSVPVENIRAVKKILDKEEIKKLIPPDAAILWSSEVFKVGDKSYREMFLLNKESEITGKYLTDARVTIGSDVQSAGRPEVNFALNRRGARIFSRVTGANIEKRLAIVLDGRVFTAPRIQSKIPDGRGRITGIQDMDEAKLISIILKAGALPAPVQIIEERTIGPSLGKDSVTQGQWSALIGMGIVILFMIVYYKMAGFVADIALLLNLVVLMAVLAQFKFTLTLPGVAGIVLTIGMAVDANVLVFERIREELRTGKTVRASIDSGYARAFRTILDANITTLLTALVLYQFGTGPIRGFAITLSIGIVVSMFTALIVTRLIFDYITYRRTLTKLSI
jgi:preprotein translocase subunit SecD